MKAAGGFGFSGAAALILIASAFAVGCGDDGASQEELDRARAEGAKEAKEEARVKQLQRQLNQLQREQRGKRESTGGSAGSGSSAAPAGGPAKYCAGGVGASAATSCDFAMNVAGEYGSNPGAATIGAYSPVTGQHYTMSCAATSGWSAVCTGGNGAVVFIP